MDQRVQHIEAQVKERHQRSKNKSSRKRINLIACIGRANDWCCRLCGKPFSDLKEVSVDHIVPVAKGGKDARTNLQATHYRCNNNRGKMPVVYFQMYLAMRRKFPNCAFDSNGPDLNAHAARKRNFATIPVDIVAAAE